VITEFNIFTVMDS